MTCRHENTWFDRSICPEPCGSMHTICSDCGATIGGCRFDEVAARAREDRERREARMLNDLIRFWSKGSRGREWVLNYYGIREDE